MQIIQKYGKGSFKSSLKYLTVRSQDDCNVVLMLFSTTGGHVQALIVSNPRGSRAKIVSSAYDKETLEDKKSAMRVYVEFFARLPP